MKSNGGNFNIIIDYKIINVTRLQSTYTTNSTATISSLGISRISWDETQLQQTKQNYIDSQYL